MIVRSRQDKDRGSMAAGVAGTLVFHVGAVVLLWATVKSVDIGPPVYAVELVAAPAPAPAAKPAPDVVQRPPAEEPAPNKPAPPKPTDKPAPPKPKPADKPPEKTEPTPRSTPTNAPLPGEKPSTGNDLVSVSIPGMQFPFPEYLRNIVQEIYRRWDRPSGNSALRAEVSFLIMRDGSVREIKLTRNSGNFSFDLSAQGAIEAAGSAGAFGALPEGWQADVLPVSFYFTPRTQ